MILLAKSLSVGMLFVGVATAVALAGCRAPAPQTGAPAAQLAAPREPRRLETRLTIDMREMFFATAEGTRGGPLRVPAEKVVGLRISNKGTIDHEIAFGREVIYEEGRPSGYRHNLFGDIPVDVFVYPSGKKVEVETEGGVEELEMEPGAEVWLRMTFPAEAKGEWEIACFTPGHYEEGMRAKFIIE